MVDGAFWFSGALELDLSGGYLVFLGMTLRSGANGAMPHSVGCYGGVS